MLHRIHVVEGFESRLRHLCIIESTTESLKVHAGSVHGAATDVRESALSYIATGTWITKLFWKAICQYLLKINIL